MKTAKKITPASFMKDSSLEYWNLVKGEIYEVKREYFSNGEGQVKTDKGTWPSIFFEDVK